MMPFRLLILFLATFVSVHSLAASEASQQQNWWEETPWGDPDRGFNWYPDPQELKPEKKEETPPPPKPKTIYEMTTLEEIKKELDRLKGEAVVNPTEERILTFLRAQNWVMDKSSLFADMSRRVVWANPDVNYASRSTTVNYSLQKDRTRESEDREKTLKELVQTHGLLYFSRSDCKYCKDQGPILKAFSQRTGLSVLAVSLDGGPVAMFPEAKQDNGISMMASGGNGIETVPALFLVNRATRQMIPLGTGVIAAEEISERMRVLVKTKPGQEF